MADDITQPALQPVPQPTKPSRLKLILLIEAFIFIIVIITGLLVFTRRKNQTMKNSTPSPTPTVQVENKINSIGKQRDIGAITSFLEWK